MHVPDLDPHFQKIICQVFCHAFCECCNKGSKTHLSNFLDLSDQVVYLVLHRAHDDIGVNKTCRADNLLDNSSAFLKFIFRRSCRDVYHLIDAFLELIIAQWAVIVRRRHAESVIDKCLFPCAVPVVHSAYLRNGGM